MREAHRRNKKHVAIVSIDIKEAFDNLKYSSTDSHLVNSRCPQNIQKLFSHLLQDRRVVIPTNEGVAQHIQTTGCPKGSCSGSALWNLVADEALKQQYPAGTLIQAFAGDFLSIAAGDSERKLGAAASEALKIFELWSDKHELQISREKTQFLQLGNLKRGPSIFWGGRRVKRVPHLKYPGVHLDSKLNWLHHLIQKGAKALQHHRQLTKLAGCTWGISPLHRAQLYWSVTERAIAHVGRHFSYRMQTKLNQIQRPFLLNITGAYRTTPTEQNAVPYPRTRDQIGH
ncbi:Putative protein in type-1 retrotransposable element R1DM [Araneus ventricosus]|uniref:Reverse transcriptase domain-containing protein n=1 Tax=Araneus ventricosus TaxID=182803 RepID=A0A4Y2RSI8_ARAVE|nr:Putative protein in type-1 retrotransposable element R1DM [Araneus ventricosus]